MRAKWIVGQVSMLHSDGCEDSGEMNLNTGTLGQHPQAQAKARRIIS